MNANGPSPIISCLQATYGRHSLVERSLACFLRQDYPSAELIILNNHAVRMRLDRAAIPPSLADKIRIVNEPCYATLGACRNRLLQLARGQFVRTWDDDDIYLPWSLSQGMLGYQSAQAASPHRIIPAWKPESSWWINGKEPAELAANAMEASILIRTDVARKYQYQESGGDEHSPLLAGLAAEGGIETEDMGIGTGYCYMWGQNVQHISGTLGQGGGSQDVSVRTHNWRLAHRDTPRRPLTPDYAAAEEVWARISLSTGASQREFMTRCSGNLARETA